MIVKDSYVLISILPNDIVNLISEFVGNPFTESRNLRKKSIVDFIKNMIIVDLKNRGYYGLDNIRNYNETVINTCLNSTNNEINDDILIDSILFNKLLSIENLELDSFLKRYNTLDDMKPIEYHSSIDIMLEDYRYLLYKSRLRDYAKPEYLYDIEDLGIVPYWEEDGYESIS